MWDCTAYTFPGGFASAHPGENGDGGAWFQTLSEGCVQAFFTDELLCCALCDSADSRRGTDAASLWFAETISTALRAGGFPRGAVMDTDAQFSVCTGLPPAPGVAAGALRVQNGQLGWSGVGDIRLYHFSGNVLCHFTRDDTPAFDSLGAQEENRVVYESLRFQPRCAEPSVRLGGGSVQPRSMSFPLLPGDALLCCSSGFWRYVFETEMEIDLCKARDAEEWLTYMLLRIAQRTHMDGEYFSVLACVSSAAV